MTTVNPLPAPFGLKLKLMRARKNLRNLRRIIENFQASDPLSVTREIGADGTHYVYRLHVVHAPNIIELIADEAIHHLRSSLDHLIAGYVQLIGKKVTDDHAFPIWREKPKTDKQVKRHDSMLKHVPNDARALIDAVQPYHRGKDANSHPLAILARLDNRFKHTSLHLLSLQIRMPSVPGIIQPPAPPLGRDSGDVFAIVPVGVDVERDFEPHLVSQVAFRIAVTGYPDVGLDALDGIYNYVRDEIICKAVRYPRPPKRL
jgi:hypothetical protein